MSQFVRTATLLALTVLLLAVAGCGAGSQGKLDVDSYSVQSLRQQETNVLNEQLFAAAQINSDPSDYLLGAGDLLQVTVFESQELNTKARVSSRGHITLPLLGQVEVKGLSAREAEVLIETMYKEKYIKDPHISVFVQEHFSQRITLIGQFKNPGTYDYLSKMRLIDIRSPQVRKLYGESNLLNPEGERRSSMKKILFFVLLFSLVV